MKLPDLAVPNHKSDKRPVVADHDEVRSVRTVDISMDRSVAGRARPVSPPLAHVQKGYARPGSLRADQKTQGNWSARD
jgi:hypothetical protein